jgi:poly(A) polymerase
MPEELQLPLPFRTLLSELIAFFSLRRVEAYATGGFLRDALLGEAIHDLDVSLTGDPLELAPELADIFNGHYFALDEERRMVRVLIPAHDLHLDLLPFEGPIEDDLMTRDFTVDAMAAPLEEVAAGSIMLIDPTDGLPDLHDRVIRLVAEKALVNDPLRLLRGVRLASLLDFRIEPITADMIRLHAGLIEGISAERKRDELVQVLRTPRAVMGLRLMDELGLLERVLPDLGQTRGVEQPKEHHWDVFGHSLAVLGALDMILDEEEPTEEPAGSLWRELWARLDWWTEGRDYFGREYVANTHRCSLVKLAGLLHDVGKPETKSFEEGGRMRFFGHAAAGAEIATRAMQRLRFSSRETDLVRGMIEAHMRPVQMAQQGLPSRKAVYRFFRDTGDAGIDTFFLSLADHLGTVGPLVDLEDWRQHVALVDYVLRKRLQEEGDVISPAKVIDGDDLMAELGLAPGPQLGELLEVVREAQAAGEVVTRDQAVALARRYLEDAPAPTS